MSHRPAPVVQNPSFELHRSDGFDDDDAGKNGVDRGRKVVQRGASSRTASESLMKSARESTDGAVKHQLGAHVDCAEQGHLRCRVGGVAGETREDGEEEQDDLGVRQADRQTPQVPPPGATSPIAEISRAWRTVVTDSQSR